MTPLETARLPPYPYPECGYDIDTDGIDIENPGTACETPICP